MQIIAIPPGTLGVDTDARITLTVAKAVRAAGKRYANRAFGHSERFVAQNLSAAEVRDMHAADLALGVIYTEPPPETRDEQLDRCDRIERDAPICDEVPRGPLCAMVVETVREVVARCRELAGEP